MEASKLGCENQSNSSVTVETKIHHSLLRKVVLRVDKPCCQTVCDIGVDIYVIFLRVTAYCELFVVAKVWNKGVAELSSLQHC